LRRGRLNPLTWISPGCVQYDGKVGERVESET